MVSASLARRHGYSLALASFDLDGLKQVNDASGNEAGDVLITSFAALLASLCRETDVPARLGGHGLSVLLPGVDEDGRGRSRGRSGWRWATAPRLGEPASP